MSSEVHVLHVDDEPDFTELVATFLERADDRLAVATARSASEGLEHLAGNGVDCVVSDYDMPVTDGLEFLRHVRTEYGDLPFLLFTGKGSEEIASEAISAGVTDYLQKGGGTDRYELLARQITNAVAGKRAHDRLEEERRRFAKLTEHATDVLVIVDEYLRFSYLSASVETILGHDPDELVGDDAISYVHPEDRHIAQSRLAEVIEDPSESVCDEVRLRAADGSWTWIEARARNAVDDPDVGGIIIYSREIADRRRVQRVIERNERRFRTIFGRSSDAMLIADDDGRYVEANRAAADLFGVAREALVGRRIEEFAPDDYDFEAAWAEFRSSNGERDTFPLVRADGEVRTVEYVATTDVVPGEHLSVLREVTTEPAVSHETGGKELQT